MRSRILGLLLLALVASAHADTLSYDLIVPLTTAPWSSVLTLPEFDPTLGSLTSVQFAVTGSIQGQLVVRNSSGNALSNTATVTADFSLLAPGGNSFDSFDVVASRYYGTPSHTTAAYDYSGSLTSLATFTDQSILDLFTGIGSVDLTGSVSPFVLGNIFSDPVEINTALAGLEVQTTYTYSPVSEPATSVLLGLGCVLLLSRKSLSRINKRTA